MLHVTPLYHIFVRHRQKEFIEPSLQGAEFVMRAAVEASITTTVTTSLTAAVGFPKILTNTATKLRTYGSAQTGTWVTGTKNRVEGDPRPVLFLASGLTHNGSVGQNIYAVRASVPTHPTEVRNHLVNFRVGNKPKMFVGDVQERKDSCFKMRQRTSAVEELHTEFVDGKANPLRELFMVNLNQQHRTRTGQLAFTRSTDDRSSGRIFCGKRGQAQTDRLGFSGWPSEKKRAGHEPSVNVIREAGGIFAPISGPMECCDDEATREEEEFCELDANAGREKGPRKLTGKTSELSTIGVVADDEAAVGLSCRDRTCRTCPHSGQVQNDGSESSDGSDPFTVSTNKTLAKPPDNPVLNLLGHPHLCMASGRKLSSEFQITATIWIDETRRRTAWRVLDVLKSHGANLLLTCRRVDTYTHRFDQKGDCPMVSTSRETWCDCACPRTPRWKRPECTWIRRGSLGHAMRSIRRQQPKLLNSTTRNSSNRRGHCTRKEAVRPCLNGNSSARYKFCSRLPGSSHDEHG